MKTKGFTLIEVILVIVIMAIAIPGLISAVSFITKSQVNAIGTTTAADLAQERMEQIMGDRMNPARGFTYIVIGNYSPPETPVAGFTNYNRTVTITCFTNSTLTVTAVCPTDYKQVQVTVQAVGVGPSVPNAVLYSLVSNY
jgi:prepilin-type N-terminal cleavage/methylation domain-containing protein